MSNATLHNFRSFLTERFTAVAVEIFGEVQSVVETFDEENKRLRNILHMVLNPEIKLSRIDITTDTSSTIDFKEPPFEWSTGADQESSEPLLKRLKEEQTECDISWGLEHEQELEGSNDFINPDCVKNDPDQDLRMPCIANSLHVQVGNKRPNASATASADENRSYRESEEGEDCPELLSEESTEEEQQSPTEVNKSKKKKKNPRQRTMLEFPRMMPYKSFIPTPNECQSFLAKLTDAFKDIPDDNKPLITTMGLADHVEYVDCAFGKVPKGCPLSYQCPVPSDRDFRIYEDAPHRPQLPLPSPKLEPLLKFPTLSVKEQKHVETIQVSWEGASILERSTREDIELVGELTRQRLTNRFKDIVTLRPGRSNAEHLIHKIKKGSPKCKSAQIEQELKTEALREYCRHLCVNWYPCGLVVHPNASWVAALPDGLVYDPNEKNIFGLVHVKCTTCRSFVDSGFLMCNSGVLQLKKRHPCYWQVQGEMMVTGTSWCDLLVFARDDILVQRIYRDKDFVNLMKEKLDEFFFYYYLPSL